MDFLSNLISLGSIIIMALGIVISLLVFTVAGHTIGDAKGHSEAGFWVSIIIWAWLMTSLLVSNEFSTFILGLL